jgi:hypothetical protein
MTGAQRYHYRRKADLARMEQEVSKAGGRGSRIDWGEMMGSRR